MQLKKTLHLGIRFIIFTNSLFLLSTLMQSQPQAFNKLLNLTLSPQTQLSKTTIIKKDQPNILEEIAKIRKKLNKKPLKEVNNLDQIAKIIVLDVQNKQTEESNLDLKQLSIAYNYPYQQIVAFTLFIPQSSDQKTANAQALNRYHKQIISPEYTQIGTYQISNNLEQINGVLYGIVLAKPR